MLSALLAKLFWQVEVHVVNPVLSLLSFARAKEIAFSVFDEPGWFALKFENRIVFALIAYEVMRQTSITYVVVPVLSLGK